MQKTITTSPNVSVLDSQVVADMCTGNFYIDLSPTQWIATGNTSVLGARIKITNPYDVDVKEYPTSGYDIAAPMSDVFSFPIPTQASNFQYGLYVVSVELTDADGKKYEIFDKITLCKPNPKDKTKNYGVIGAEILGDCKAGKVDVFISEPPVYNGNVSESKTQSVKLSYPTSSEVAPLTSTANGFSVPLYEGEYRVKGSACVTYNFGDNNYIKVNYKLDYTKKIYCIVNKRCVFERIEELNARLDSCSAKEKDTAIDTILDALRLLKTIELGVELGEDVSNYIEEMEKLLGCKCMGNVNVTAPNATLAGNVSITGCNVVESQVGLTTVYTIDNHDYLLTVNPANNFVTISAPTLTSCVKSQQLTFNIEALYTAIKGQVTTQQEFDFWAGVVNGSLTNIEGGLLVFLGISAPVWNAYTLKQKVEKIISKLMSCCASSSCSAVISNLVITEQGGKALLTWDIDSNVYFSDIYANGEFVTTIVTPLKSYLFENTTGDSSVKFKVLARCSNGALGNTLSGDIMLSGCPDIFAPSLSSALFPSATCPFNLMPLTSAPIGYTAEWHNANNTLSGSILVDPWNVSSGDYYVFYKNNVTGCYSPSSKVTIVCSLAGNCSEPLNLSVNKVGLSANIGISFSSAAVPPPSYLVKRKLITDPDIAPSYTTIGVPTYNAGTNKWEIIDNTYATNNAYTYKAESQCVDASRPSALYNFGIFTCPTLSLTRTNNSISYSFPTFAGTMIDKYKLELFDSTGSVLIDTDIYTPAFAGTISGIFTGLSDNTVYKVKITSMYSTYSSSCSIQSITTIKNNYSIQVMTIGASAVPYVLRIGATDIKSGTISEGEIISGYSGLIPFVSTEVGLRVPLASGISVADLNGVAPDIITLVDPQEAEWSSISVSTFADVKFETV